MAASNHLMSARKYYEPLRTELKQKNLPEVDRILCELESVCRQSDAESAKGASDGHVATNQDEIKFWLIDVGRLMLEEKTASTRRLALKALETAVTHLVKTNYQEFPLWTELRTTISRDYTSLLDSARSEKDPHWHRMWAVLVRVMNRDLCQGSSIINMFLSIVEAGFRSPELSIREQSFDCWRLLVEIFSNNKQINLPKRMKLICIPLKSSKSKTETIALKKFDIWWYLLNELSPNLDKLADTIFEPFIYFCFGPAFKPPLCYYFDDSFQEYGAPGKIYQTIKQLSAIALIHLLGPAPEITKTLLISADAGGRTLPFEFPKTDVIISPMLFSAKAKLLIDACIECTVLFAQMKHLDFLELNRCLWGNLMERINREKTVPKNDLLQRIKDVMNALLNLCIKQENDGSLRELLYDILLIVAKSELLTVNIGYDSPEQPMINYKSIMSVILNTNLPCPGDKSEEIIKFVFDLQRYSPQKGYWEMLQKTIQYLCCEIDDDSGNGEFRMIRTQIYCHLARHLVVQIRDDPAGFAEHQTTVMNFLLYPLEYDQQVVVNSVRSLWDEVYEPIASKENRACEFTNTFCEMIKAMTIAKFAFNLGVVAEFFCTVLRALSPEFDSTKPPMKVFELFKDLTRNAQAYQANLNRVEKMISCFRELLEKMSIKHMLTLILPIRNAINEMASNENGLTMVEVKRTLTVVANKFMLNRMSDELRRQPKEVQWNCKMLLNMMLQLPTDFKTRWKVAEMKKCMEICEGKESMTPTRKKKDEEFVVIESNWKFKPEVLTEHQREKMLEKRTDIPALYNDMSQSQDSFVIKPWTPNKKNEPLRQATDVVSSSADTVTTESVPDSVAEKNAAVSVIDSATVVGSSMVVEDESLVAKSHVAKTDKENNDGNILYDQSSLVKLKEEAVGSEEDGSEYTAGTQEKRVKKTKRSILEQLRIDTVEGKTLDVMTLARTRQSEGPESRSTRRKSIPVRKVESEKKSRVVSTTKLDLKSASVVKDGRRKNVPKDLRSSRKLLDFENMEQNIEVNPTQSLLTPKFNANASDDVIESSQTPLPSQSMVSRLVRRSKLDESSIINSRETPPSIAIECVDSTGEEKMPGIESTKEVAMSIDEEPKPVKENDTTENVHQNGPSMKEHQSNQVAGEKGEEGEERSDTIVPQVVTLSEPPKVNDDNTDKNDGTNEPEPKTTETCMESASNRSSSNRVVECIATPLSPSRRSKRLNSVDDNAVVVVHNSPSNRVSEVCKSPKKTMLHINQSPLHSLTKQDKGTPTKEKLSNGDFPVRVALQLLNSPKRNHSEGTDHNVADNRATLASPKVARYSPLVVVEPMKDFPAVAKGDEISAEKDESQKWETIEAVSAVLPPEQPAGNVQSGTADALSPVKNLDEEMEPLNKSLNRSIVSSPDLADAEERNTDLMNSTLNISPILEEKGGCPKAVDGSVLAGSAERRSSGRILGKEKDSGAPHTPVVQMGIMSRRSKLGPPSQVLHSPAVANSGGLKCGLRAQQNQSSMPTPSPSVMSVPRSPSTSMINLGGRGAQLINLIRQSPNPNTPPQNASTPKGGGQPSSSANRLMMRKKAIVTSAATGGTLDSNAAQSATKESEEVRDTSQYLVFSKVLPSPQASPASGILKRRHNVDDSGDDIESPINKRKRVSFHDPPVSMKKEYIRQVEECRSPSISRSLQLATSMSSADKAKYMMRRRSKSDSISELQNFTKNRDDQQSTDETGAVSSSDTPCTEAIDVDGDEEELTSSPESLDESQFMIQDATADSMTPLQVTVDLMDGEKGSDEDDAAGVDGGKPKCTSPKKASDGGEGSSGGELRFASEEAVLQHVLQRYALDDIVERYLAGGRTLENGKTVRMLTKELSSVMSKDPKARHLVLDELSERHSVEFLEHAIQENSSAMVCERLSLSAMIDYIFRHLHNDCVAGATASSTSSSSPSTLLDEKDSDSLRVIERIYEKLFNLPNIESNKQTLSMLKDRFLREHFARKTRLEVMALLEDYFKTSDHT